MKFGWRAVILSVGHYHRWIGDTKLTLTDTHGTIEVCGNEQFTLGRDLKW